MNTAARSELYPPVPWEDLYKREMFSRLDESDDEIFYQTDRFVNHIDSVALATVRDLADTLIVEKDPIILDLMAGWNSHIPPRLAGSKIVGLGLNQNELARNKALSEWVLHDLNKDPRLPFGDATFDVVLNALSVDYMTRPFEVFREVARILKPGGLFLVTFSNRMFRQKATRLWRESSEPERVLFVEDLFRLSGGFETPRQFLSKGRPRPKDDKYAHLGIPSDPVYAVYADRKGGNPNRKPRPVLRIEYGSPIGEQEFAARLRELQHTLRCPYCGERLLKWAVPDNPYSTWSNDFMYICFNDACPYLVRGWSVMNEQGNPGVSYRLMYNPERNVCLPIPVPTLSALKDGIVEEFPSHSA